jgi:hypothetical protein
LFLVVEPAQKRAQLFGELAFHAKLGEPPQLPPVFRVRRLSTQLACYAAFAIHSASIRRHYANLVIFMGLTLQ